MENTISPATHVTAPAQEAPERAFRDRVYTLANMASNLFPSRYKGQSLVSPQYESAAEDAVLIAADLLERTEKRERENAEIDAANALRQSSSAPDRQ